MCGLPHAVLLRRARNSYTMEDWLHFVVCYSWYIFQKASLPPVVYRLWDQLRACVCHYLRPPAPEDSRSNAERADAGRDLALGYAKALEETKAAPAQLFKPNLHLVVCR
jgi:hypothetical protein